MKIKEYFLLIIIGTLLFSSLVLATTKIDKIYKDGTIIEGEDGEVEIIFKDKSTISHRIKNALVGAYKNYENSILKALDNPYVNPPLIPPFILALIIFISLYIHKERIITL